MDNAPEVIIHKVQNTNENGDIFGIPNEQYYEKSFKCYKVYHLSFIMYDMLVLYLTEQVVSISHQERLPAGMVHRL